VDLAAPPAGELGPRAWAPAMTHRVKRALNPVTTMGTLTLQRRGSGPITVSSPIAASVPDL
jgi:hypothetical protein